MPRVRRAMRRAAITRLIRLRAQIAYTRAIIVFHVTLLVLFCPFISPPISFMPRFAYLMRYDATAPYTNNGAISIFQRRRAADDAATPLLMQFVLCHDA